MTASPLRLVRVGVAMVNESLCIRGADTAFHSLVERSAAALEGAPLMELISPDNEHDAIAVREAAASTYIGTIVSNASQVLVSFSRLPAGLIATVTSVNEYLIESQALARVQLRNTVESIIAGFAHEVRNPMASILSLTEATLQQNLTQPTELVRIPGLVARVESLIQQSLAYSRPKPPKRELHRPSFLVDRASTLLRPREKPSRIEAPEDDGGVSAVIVDLLHAEQILVNLLENALDVSADVVTVTLSKGHTRVPSVCIEVADDGPGVPAETAPRIFDPFFTTKANGTGLGLAIARDLARLNGGDLKLVTNVKRGAAFRLYLPSTPTPVRGNW